MKNILKKIKKIKKNSKKLKKIQKNSKKNILLYYKMPKRTGKKLRVKSKGERRVSRGSRRVRAQTARKQRRSEGSRRVENKRRVEAKRRVEEKMPESPKRKRKTKGKRPLNAYMKALKKARDNDEESFEYNGKTYKRTYAKTGMAIYKPA